MIVIQFGISPIIMVVVSTAGLGIFFGALLGYAVVAFRVKKNPLVEQINAILPQTQCGQCGYPGCRPYAEALANNDEAINKCPPGGEAGIRALAALLDKDVETLDAEHGEEKPLMVAYIREDECIGCTKCIQACPVDAILGAAKLMHTVISEECTGCDLCVDPCPVDCIEMRPAYNELTAWQWKTPQLPGHIIATDIGQSATTS